ncbi:MAG: hypothetical protein HYY68_04450 [Thaumarchaeota archaeon]|nr:hypothetical protein [Nitrososphaerota archaeon]MBI3022963.1 hypothetical protein [Nitrososphaerota archaeon]
MDRGKVQAELKGNTLRVYVYALKRKHVGVREVQRSLRLSNPSLAQYHLNKLKELGLLKEEGGEYEIVSNVNVDVMRDFLRVGTLLVPRFIFYAVLFTVFTAYLGSISLRIYADSPIVLWFTMLMGLASLIFWYEAQKAWRSAPSP